MRDTHKMWLKNLGHALYPCTIRKKKGPSAPDFIYLHQTSSICGLPFADKSSYHKDGGAICPRARPAQACDAAVGQPCQIRLCARKAVARHVPDPDEAAVVRPQAVSPRTPAR